MDVSGGPVTIGGPSSQLPQNQAQVFTAGVSVPLERVELHLRRDLSAQQSLTVELRATEAGVPAAAVLASATLEATKIPEVADWVSVPLSAEVEGATAYAIVASAPGGDVYEWSVAAGDAYAGGQRFRQPLPPGPAWTASVGDAAFSTYLVGEVASFTTVGCRDWTVPLGVAALGIHAVGARGVANTVTYPYHQGGVGDGVVGRLTVRGGDVLGVCAGVGGGGSVANGGAGGGASGVAMGSGFASPLLVAAGGGGGGSGQGGFGVGGAAGMPNGEDAQALAPPEVWGTGGKGGTQTGPGAGGIGGGTAGSGSGSSGPGVGGMGKWNAGGGGAGYFGGGGGGGSSSGFEGGYGGGGGSDFCTSVPAMTGCRRVAGEGTAATTGPGPGEAKVLLHYMVAGAPRVGITGPRDGARFIRGQKVETSFSCKDADDGPGIESCVDGARRRSGAALDTSETGRQSFTVTATSKSGKTARESVAYTVLPASTTRLTLTGAEQTAGRWRLPGRTSRRNRRLPVGTTFTFALNVDAPVRFTFSRRTTGRRSGGKCVRQTRSNRRARACTRTIRAGAITRTGKAGRNAVRFRGSLSRTRKLRPGRYNVILTATAAGQTATSPRLAFSIIG